MLFLSMSVFVFCFFFQAEDGIRDWSVTGVQTCALPIWRDLVVPAAQAIGDEVRGARFLKAELGMLVNVAAGRDQGRARSEERRGGEEGRRGGWRSQGETKMT